MADDADTIWANQVGPGLFRGKPSYKTSQVGDLLTFKQAIKAGYKFVVLGKKGNIVVGKRIFKNLLALWKDPANGDHRNVEVTLPSGEKINRQVMIALEKRPEEKEKIVFHIQIPYQAQKQKAATPKVLVLGKLNA